MSLPVPAVCVLSGCLTNALWNERKAHIEVLLVENVPEEAEVVDIADSRLEEMPLVREMVTDAVREGNTARRLNWERAKQLDRTLEQELPTHDHTVYIRKEDTIVSVSILYQS